MRASDLALLSLSLALAISSVSATVARHYGSPGPGTARTNTSPPAGVSSNGLLYDNQTFDDVIVGGGTAGLVLANRLSADPGVTVAVIEAGESGAGDTSLTTPHAECYANRWTGQLHNSSVGTAKDWQYTVESQAGLNNRTVSWPRGKVLGGSSAINGMYLVRQPAVEQQGWVNLISDLSSTAGTTWGWNNVLAAMKKSETFTAANQSIVSQLGESVPYDSAAHGESGPVQHSFPGQEYAHRHQPLDLDPQLFSRPAYLDPILKERSNLFVLTKHQVTRILFDTSGSVPRATGVQCALSSHDWVHTIHASSEVILAAGDIGSPHLLQLSGVGEPDMLSSLGIELVANVSGGGYHLQDHLSSTPEYQPANASIALPTDHVTGNAVLDSYVNSATAYVPLSKLLDKDEYLSELANSTDQWVAAYDAPPAVRDGYRAALQQLGQTVYAGDAPAVELLWSVQWGELNVQCALQHSTSQGAVRIRTRSAWDKPSLNPNYVQHTLDLKLLRRGCQMARQLANASPLRQYVGSEIRPGTGVETQEEWDGYLASSSGTEYHPSSTCSLLPYELGGVVDDQLRVYGTKALRVVDSSVPPMSMSQHLMTITYAIAEIGAEMIMQARQ